MTEQKSVDETGWHRAKFSCRVCSYNCDILQDLEYKGEHDDWQFPCLSAEVELPIWNRTWVGEVLGK
jgi:hypothetical protein